MLFVGCSNCQQIVQLYCTGQFMPHVPIPAVNYGGLPACQYCGQMQPIFTCSICWTRQMLMLVGPQAQYNPAYMQQLMNSGMMLAPVIPSNSSRVTQSSFRNIMMKGLESAAQQFGKRGVDFAFDAFGSWMEGSY